MGLRFNPFTGTLDIVSVEDLSGYVTLDQTTPQTITGGAPLFGGGLRSLDNLYILPYQLTDPKVDSPPLVFWNKYTTASGGSPNNLAIYLDSSGVLQVGSLGPFSCGGINFASLPLTTTSMITGSDFKITNLVSKTILGTDSDGKIIEGTHEGVGEIDGGFVNSVYLVAQAADGGGA